MPEQQEQQSVTRYYFPKGTHFLISLGGIRRASNRLGFPVLDMDDCWRVRAGLPPRVLTLAQNYKLRQALRDVLPSVDIFNRMSDGEAA